MTGIERLHKLIADIDVSADPELWDILRGGTEGGWGCEEHDDKTLGSTLAAIAEQIKREQGGRVSRMRVLSVVTGMERHASGVEGAEDSPVARWARELRAALGGYRRDPAADVSVSAYDLLPQEEREAIAWVRDHGGLDHVKAEWRSRVPYDLYERRRQRLLDHIAECETALGRRNQRIEELGHRVGDLTTENAELRRRSMPDGCEWPRYESGELVGFGDDVSRLGKDFEVNVIALYRDGSFSLNFCAYSKDERVNRPAPKALDADGVEIRVGDVLYRKSDGHMVEVAEVYEKTFIDADDYVRPGDGFTHRAPVFAADGAPLEVGQTVWHVGNGVEFTVIGLINHGERQVVKLRLSDDGSFTALNPDHLTHERPDSWERIEDDATLGVNSYRERYGIKKHDGMTWPQLVREDLVRRCRVLAERERGE